jgi:hypothetical protein
MKSLEGVYIVGFRSRQIRGDHDCIERMHEAWDGPHHMARKWVCVVGPLFRLVASLIDFFYSRSSISWKNDVAKSLGLWRPEGPWKSKTCKNKEFCFVVLKLNERRLFNPWINGKQVCILIKLSNNLEYDIINYIVHGCILHASGASRAHRPIAEDLTHRSITLA